MVTPTLQDLAIRLSAVDGIGATVPSQADIPTIESDLNGLHTTINQLVLTLQTQWNTILTQLQAVQASLAVGYEAQDVRVGPITITATTLHTPITVNFPAPFADGLYTVEATVVLGEAISTAPCFVAGVQQQGTAGNGILVWVMNSDSVTHNVTVNVSCRHD